MTKFEEFRKNGYVVIRNALTAQEISELRELSFNIFEEKRKNTPETAPLDSKRRTVYTKTFLENPKLVNVMFKKTIVDVLKEVFGEDYITFIQFSLGENLHSPVWHTDSQSQGSAQYLFHQDYNISKCGLYFQEDDDIYGGQLEIKPGSHLPSCLGTKSFLTTDARYGKISRLQLLATMIRTKLRKNVRVNLNGGDILLFHGMLWHRASQPDWSQVEAIDNYGVKNPPKEKHKFMVQFEVSPNNYFAPLYVSHQQWRASIQENGQYIESDEVRFPDDFDESTLELIKANDCKIGIYQEMGLDMSAHNLKTPDGLPIVIFENKGVME